MCRYFGWLGWQDVHEVFVLRFEDVRAYVGGFLC